MANGKTTTWRKKSPNRRNNKLLNGEKKNSKIGKRQHGKTTIWKNAEIKKTRKWNKRQHGKTTKWKKTSKLKNC